MKKLSIQKNTKNTKNTNLIKELSILNYFKKMKK